MKNGKNNLTKFVVIPALLRLGDILTTNTFLSYGIEEGNGFVLWLMQISLPFAYAITFIMGITSFLGIYLMQTLIKKYSIIYDFGYKMTNFLIVFSESIYFIMVGIGLYAIIRNSLAIIIINLI